MTFRTRILLAYVPVVLVPLVVFGLGVRRVVSDRLTAQYQRRVESLIAVIREDLARESASLAARLDGLKQAAIEDNRLRLAAVRGVDRAYLLDYAGNAMRLAGLSMLQIQDEAGRIVSSGHFRNEFDRLEPELPGLVAEAPGGLALLEARTPEAPFLVIARVDSFRLGTRRFTIVGGLTVDSLYLARLARDTALQVSLVTPRDTLATAVANSGNRVVAEVDVPYVDADTARAPPARVVVSHSLASLEALRRRVDLLFVAAVLATALVALLLAGWLSSRVSGPLAALAEKTAAIDLDRLDVAFESDRPDEIGALARLLGVMTERLRVGAAKLREAERRVALGDLARQVNHDVKNALGPLRNVFRHFAQVARERPNELPMVFAERQGTLEASLSYLESLAANYARLYPQPDRRPCDVNAVVRETLRHVGETGRAELKLALADGLPAVRADALVLRRVLENLVGNALDALEARPGEVTVSTERVNGGRGAAAVRIVVADTGKGMTPAELERAFDDFYTTKPGGTGLGLSIVRRLVLDSSGSLRVETAPGTGSKFIVELPA